MGNLCVSEITVINNNNNENNDNKTQPGTKKDKQYPVMIVASLPKNETTNQHQLNQANDKQFNLRKSIKHKPINLNDKKENSEAKAFEIKQKNNRQSEDKKLIEECLLKHFFMRSLEQAARIEIIKEMSLAFVKENTVLFQQGYPANYFYILKAGKCKLIINDTKCKEFNVGESFGELALLHDTPRSGTVITTSVCFLWVLDRKSFRKIVDHITKANFEENKTFIESIPILASIEYDQKAILCSSLYKETFDAGQMIVKEGEQSHCIFIVKEGEVNIIHQKKPIRTLKKGDNFGERSILIDSVRTMDVVAKSNCVCYSISVPTLKNMLGDNFRKLLYLNFIKSSFSTSLFFSKFNPYYLDQFFEKFDAVNLSKNDIAFNAGYIKSSSIVVVIDGNLINRQSKEIIGNRGSILFEKELLTASNDAIDYDILPYPDCLLIKANMNEVNKILKGSLMDILQKSEMINSFAKIAVFKHLSNKKQEIISKKIEIEKYKDGETIIEEGKEGDKFYIVKKGKIDISSNGKYLRTLNEKEHFGERAFFFNESRSACAKAKGSVEVFYLSRDDFLANIEENMKEHLMNRLYLQDNTIELSDLNYVMKLGNGNYGNVFLVQCSKNKVYYALKQMSRSQINHEEMHPNILLERSVLLQIDHPFIMKLVKTLKDDKFIYFLMEYIRGKELFDVIRDIGLLTKEQTQFYGGSLMISIDYLHERKFIYRDLKPENIIVLCNGYIKIIDFGTAKIITDRTSTIIGTPHYMAPEVILGEGYSFHVDIWSIAVCLYEFYCGGLPFGESADDPMEIYLEIINGKLTFPLFCKDKDFKQLILKMLNKNPGNRLTKITQIKNHIWFKNFNWEDLICLNMKPVNIPIIKKNEHQTSEGSMPFIDYVKKNCKEWEASNKNDITIDQRREYDKWYREF